MKLLLKYGLSVLLIITLNQISSGQNPSQKTGHQQHETHHEEVNRRGDHAMGFSHAKTTHHFRLTKEGGTIEVTANDPADTASRDQIRRHLKHISLKFSDGDFAAPMFIHGENPPGVDEMKKLKNEIKYQFEEIDRGAKVRVSTHNVDAIKAIHEFLRFQIKDHQTGDSSDVVDGN